MLQGCIGLSIQASDSDLNGSLLCAVDSGLTNFSDSQGKSHAGIYHFWAGLWIRKKSVMHENTPYHSLGIDCGIRAHTRSSYHASLLPSAPLSLVPVYFRKCLLSILTGSFLLLASCFLFLAQARGATLRWEALPDRERVTISIRQSEGFPGTVGRIALTGVIVPFTEVPSGLYVAETPKEAKLFKGTQQQGRSLVLLTQTPEFGFLVSRHTPQEVVVELFSNPLGARWKPSAKAPTTEMAPDEGIPLSEIPDAANLALSVDPQGKTAVSEALKAQTATPVDRNALSQRQPVRQGQNPVVVLSGSPTHALSATKQAEPPLENVPLPSVPSGRSIPKTSVPLVSEPVTSEMEGNAEVGQASSALPIWNAEAQTSDRSAPLPVPPPPLPAGERAAAQEGRGRAAAPKSEGVFRQGIGASPAASPKGGTAALPAQLEPGRASGVTAVQGGVPGSSAQAVPSKPAEADMTASTPGVGVPVARGRYSGLIDTGEVNQPRPNQEHSPSGASSVRESIVREEIPLISRTETQAGSSMPERPAEPVVIAAPGFSEPVQPNGETASVTAALPVDAGRVEPTPGAEGELPPPDPDALLQEIGELIKKGDFTQALAATDFLLTLPDLTSEQQETLLHIRAEMLYVINKDDFAGHYLEISDATTKALNYNPKSKLNAGALLRLGYMNLKLNNIPEAEARFNLLRRLYPEDDNVPLTYYYWGEYYYGRNQLQKSSDEFQLILQKYPNSRYAREAALGLARSLYRLGYYDQAFTVVDYIERRWERFYLDFPPFLNMMGDVAYRLDKLDFALNHYWLYINLEPNGEESDIILTRIGDIYTAKREKEAAGELYRESIRRFPGKDGALVAKMRLAEEGIYDDPSIAGMFSIFDGPFSLRPLEVYESIIKEHPGSALVPLAKIKLAMWHLWKKDFTAALDDVSDFLEQHPKDPLVPKAKEVALQAFALLAAAGVSEERYAHMRDIWEKYPIVHSQAAELSPESRIALGVSYWKEGKPNEALDAIGPFFLGSKVPEYSEMALSLVLSLYLEYEQWQAIEEVAKRVELWEIKPETEKQLDYALALAAENMGQNDRAAPIWQKLYDSSLLNESEKAYASFFLARHAEKERNLEKAYTLGRESLNRLLQQTASNPNPADVAKIKSQLGSLMDVAETAGRLREALGFAEQYLQYLGANDAERMAVRYRMARIYRKQGDQEQWKTILTELSSSNPDSVYGRIASSELSSASLAKDAAKYSPTGRL